MSERRMLTKKVTDDDRFMNLSSSAQALYLHLNMSADDDGFCNQVSVAMFKAHASVQDLEALLAARYLLQFDSGVIVIKHWRMANALRKDRYTPTTFQDELAKLKLKENGAYTERLPSGCQVVASCLPQDRIGKDSVGKDRLDKTVSIRAREARDPEDDGFEAFWASYPVKSGDIRQAYFEYVGALQGGATAEEIMAAVEWQSKEKDTRYMPSAEKWLRNKGWTEEKPKPKEKSSGKRRQFRPASEVDYDPVDMDALKKVLDQI